MKNNEKIMFLKKCMGFMHVSAGQVVHNIFIYNIIFNFPFVFKISPFMLKFNE